MTCTCVKFEVVSVSCCNFTVMQPRKHATVFFWIYKLVVFCHPLAHGCITMQEFSPIFVEIQESKQVWIIATLFCRFCLSFRCYEEIWIFLSHTTPPPWCYVWSWLKNINLLLPGHVQPPLHNWTYEYKGHNTFETVVVARFWGVGYVMAVTWNRTKKGPPPLFIRPFETREGVILRDIFVVFE